MASITVASEKLQSGTSTAAYPQSNWPAHRLPPTGAPVGSATQTVTAGNTGAAFTDLDEDTRYYAYQQVGSEHRYVGFSTFTNVPPAQQVVGSVDDESIGLRHLTDLTRTGGWIPTNAIDQTIPDRLSVANNQSLVSGTLYVTGGIVVPANETVTSISFFSGTTGVGAGNASNQWYCLIDPENLAVLATTVDDTTNAWTAQTVKTLQLATALGGSTPGGTYTPAADKEIYVGACVAFSAGSPTIRASATSAPLASVPPIQSATSSTGLTNPASLGATAGALTGMGNLLYGWVSRSA